MGYNRFMRMCRSFLQQNRTSSQVRRNRVIITEAYKLKNALALYGLMTA